MRGRRRPRGRDARLVADLTAAASEVTREAKAAVQRGGST